MSVLFKIAFRNLREHRSKTLIIGIIIALGIALMLVGNALMDTAGKGIRRSFIENYTGHVMISGKAEVDVSLFGIQGPEASSEEVPRIPQYEAVYEYAASLPQVQALAAQVTGFTLFSFEDKGNQFGILFGIEPESYRAMFPDSITMVSGRYLEPGEEGILLSEGKIEEIRDELEISLQVGDRVVLSGLGPAGFRIREVPIRGVFRFRQEVEGLSQINFIDVQSLRALLGMVVASAGALELEEEEIGLLSAGGAAEEQLFGGSMVESAASEEVSMTEDSLLGILGERAEGSYAASIDSGAWNFLLLQLEDESQVVPVIAELNGWFAAEEIEAQAVDWKAASGGFGSLADTLQVVFNVLILIIAVVAVIIIMNTLVISVIERTTEIGTMRALGAHKGMVRWMFVLETASISLVFGLVGIALGAGIIGILNLTGIPAPNPFFEILFGGKVLHPLLPLSAVLYALLVIIAIGVLASLYPVAIALRIQPVRAIQTEG
ncbi:MAG: ABC transporter permease [Spirochaetales bacterium]|nr:ABC transporter permease [Spirochaetales bacterium]